MNILIINCHTDNRGDEAAVHALIDELNCNYNKLSITLSMRGEGRYPNLPDNVTCISQFIPARKKAIFANRVAIISKGKISLSQKEKQLIEAIKHADIILHAPGGPSIGDTYYDAEPTYLRIFDLIRALHKPYMFYAPSMGPFEKTGRNKWRKKILTASSGIALRDPVSADHLKKLLPEIMIHQTLDSALQYDVDLEANQKKLEGYKELKTFLKKHEKCIGITITDLQWHPVYSRDTQLKNRIQDTFRSAIDEIIQNGFGVIFIPQLYGNGNDYNLMSQYVVSSESCYVVKSDSDLYDAYFQQYLISKLYMVIGMRYHSNIFSAKMGTPFISISYEQKMQGFMKKIGLEKYCIAINELNYERLKSKMELVVKNYGYYKNDLLNLHDSMKAESLETTKIVNNIIKDYDLNNK